MVLLIEAETRGLNIYIFMGQNFDSKVFRSGEFPRILTPDKTKFLVAKKF